MAPVSKASHGLLAVIVMSPPDTIELKLAPFI
jgi:hypothetical protein